MRKLRKKRAISLGVFILIIVLFLLMVPNFKNKKNNDNVKDQSPQINFVGKTIAELEDYAKKNNYTLNKEYVYDKKVLENVIISYEIKNKIINVTISKGKIPLSVYEENNVNELGKVPIMMYHSIVNTTDNKYTGGNVDKDGYNRTAKAFREDLEFYYQNNYRMIRLIDYVNGNITTELGKSPIILTFDDGNLDNFKVLGKNDNNELIIDPNSAVGILEEFKKKYKDFNVTATFFLNNGLFQQKEYDEEIIKWLVDNGYDIGNHTTTHDDITKISTSKTEEIVGKLYEKLDSIIPSKYVNIVALPYGSPYSKTHSNFSHVLKATYNNKTYETISTLRVGWEPELSPFDKNFDKTFLKRCRAYDNNGKEFDIKMVFTSLSKTRYISDGDSDTIVFKDGNNNLNTNINKEIIKY